MTMHTSVRIASTLAPGFAWLRALTCTQHQALMGDLQTPGPQPAQWPNTKGARQPPKSNQPVSTPPTLCVCALVYDKGVA